MSKALRLRNDIKTVIEIQILKMQKRKFIIITLNSCFISHGIKSKLAFKQRMECNNQRRYSIT